MCFTFRMPNTAIVAVAVLLSLAGRSRAVELVGYVPYYRLSSNNYLNNILPDQLSLLDEVRYFGLSVNSSGGISSLSGSVTSQKNNIATIKGIIDSLPANERPRLDITLGGASVDSVFTTIAASSSLRTTLAQNVDDLLDETGATSVDIDWEHPDVGIERTTNYPALLKRIKQEIGAEKRVQATVAPSVVISNSVLTGTDAIDGISLMTYDLGWWSSDPGNPNDGEHSLHEYVEDAVAAWTDPMSANSQRPWVWTNSSWGNDVAPDKLGVGLPFYGRNIFGNDAYTYADLVSNGTPLGNGYYSMFGQTVWIPDQTTIEDRIQLAHDEGLQNVFIWEMGQDLDSDNSNSMLRIAADKRDSLIAIAGDFDGNGVVNGADLAQWEGDFGVNANSDADDDGDSDGFDFLTWQQNLTSTDGFAASVNSVPEPGSLALVILGLANYCAGRRLERTRC
jgi:GH18 family chitinase